LKQGEALISEIASSGRQGFVVAFFLKNVDVVNRRFGFAAGDVVLKTFAAYLGRNLVAADRLFRWRGPCFVVIGERPSSLEMLKAEAERVGCRGPEQEVEGQGRSILFRLTAATAVFPIVANRDNSGLPSRIDQFAAQQFKEGPRAR
jgi:GGDEF domain-containing protein